jgi:primosomal protein N' (replication factor Y)
VKHRDLRKTVDAAATLAHLLRKNFGSRVLGPEFPLVARIMNYHIQHILLKMERDSSLREQKNILRATLAQVLKNPDFGGVRLIPDVDPV